MILFYGQQVATPTININEPGMYALTVSNSDLCSVARTITVLSSSIPVIEHVLISDTTNPERVSLHIEVLGSGNYVYAVDIDPLEIGVDDNYQANNIINGVLYGKHIIYVKDLNGCGFTTKEIYVLSYPRFVTPNNDGHYDTWNLNHPNRIFNDYYSISTVKIFDRYGKVIAEIDPKGLGWDGMYHGEPVIESDYWFIVNLTNYKGKTITKKGHFSLKY